MTLNVSKTGSVSVLKFLGEHTPFGHLEVTCVTITVTVTVNCLLSTVYCLLSTVYCLLSTVNCQLSTVNCQLSLSLSLSPSLLLSLSLPPAAIHLILCKILGLHGDDYEEFHLLIYKIQFVPHMRLMLYFCILSHAV
jgi:hypothetical protein